VFDSVIGMSPAAAKPVILWSHPRSVSTAFERAFINRKDDVQCFHEPFGEPFYYSAERMSTRYTEEQCKASGQHTTSYAQVLGTIMDAAKNSGKTVFVKDMSQYIVKPDAPEGQNPTVFSDEQLRDITHSFLIRTPEKSVPSYYRCCSGEQAKETGFDSYDPNEAGYVESVTLYKYLKSIGLDPIIVDSGDLVQTPKKIMKAYCDHVGVDYRDDMIEWKAEKVESFDKWKGFHDDAQQSTGFKEVVREKEQFPQVVIDTIAKNQAPYAFLREHRIQV